ncbi:MAG: glycosyltransferase, partial [Anaerolineae bacterium]|nr:glycosyltransferase [Anaerolineae bacterium]
MPEISVVMSVYNGEAYLKQAVESILNQTFPDFEFIILNDCSIDRTANILQDYAERDSRIKILHNEQNLGLTASLNRGLRAAQGAYIARQDADDISLPTRFAEQVHFLNQNPDVVLVSGNIEQINAAGQVIGHLNRAAPPELVRW